MVIRKKGICRSLHNVYLVFIGSDTRQDNIVLLSSLECINTGHFNFLLSQINLGYKCHNENQQQVIITISSNYPSLKETYTVDLHNLKGNTYMNYYITSTVG